MSNKIYLDTLNEELMMLPSFIASMHSLAQSINYNDKIIYFRTTNLIDKYSDKVYKDYNYRRQILIWLAEWIRTRTSSLNGYTLRCLNYKYKYNCEIII